jgi:uncharacterized protein
MGHLKRVSAISQRFAKEENGDELVAYAAGMLHDIVNLPKDHPDSKSCSRFAAERAEQILKQLNFPNELIPNVCHAIHAHSFSANVEPKTVEARCLQDADRMEALGALGLMRVCYVSGKIGRQLMHETDPAGRNRPLDDKRFALDHFPIKLLTLYGTMKTQAGKKMARPLSIFLEEFRNDILQEKRNKSGHFEIAEVCHQAGKMNKLLFNLEDPFTEKGRDLFPDRYALDGLMGSQDEYIRKFFDQLRFELNRHHR